MIRISPILVVRKCLRTVEPKLPVPPVITYCEAVEMDDTGILDLDHENDFELMEVIAEYLLKNNSRKGFISLNCLNNQQTILSCQCKKLTTVRVNYCIRNGSC